jgi:spoIIIJ-associated protein
MREIERSAASVEEALEQALEELGVSEQEAEVEIVQDPGCGFLGLKSQPAVVRVRVPEPGLSEEQIEEQVELAEEFLAGLLELMGLDVDLDHQTVDGTMYVDVLAGEDPDSMGLLIGRHGQTLDALQDVVRAVVQRHTEERCRIMVDVEDYRKRRRTQIAGRARDVARRVVRTGRPERLEAMNAFERKVAHDAAAQVSGVETESEGEEPERRVVIRKKGGGPRPS